MRLCEKCLAEIRSKEWVEKSTPEKLGEIFLDAIDDDKEMFCDDCKYELGLLMIPGFDL